MENPGNVISWVVAADGQVRAGKEIRGTKYHTLYRENNKAGWVSLPGLDWSDPEAYPLGFSTDGYTLYVGRLTPEKTWGVYPYDLVKKTVGEPRAEDIHSAAVCDGVAQSRRYGGPGFGAGYLARRHGGSRSTF